MRSGWTLFTLYAASVGLFLLLVWCMIRDGGERNACLKEGTMRKGGHNARPQTPPPSCLKNKTGDDVVTKLPNPKPDFTKLPTPPPSLLQECKGCCRWEGADSLCPHNREGHCLRPTERIKKQFSRRKIK